MARLSRARPKGEAFLKFTYDGHQYKLSFEYRKDSRETTARLIRGEDPHGRDCVIGLSFCHPNDNPCRETGRKIAIRDAIRSIPSIISEWFDGKEPPREFRRAIWNAYWDRPKFRNRIV